jgi:hypothetical protein
MEEGLFSIHNGQLAAGVHFFTIEYARHGKLLRIRICPALRNQQGKKKQYKISGFHLR